MSLISLLLIIVVIALLFSLFNGTAWGYGPSSALGIIVVVLLILILTGNVSL